MGEDGKIITYNLNNYEENDESEIIFRDEILVKEVLLKEQVILFFKSKPNGMIRFRQSN